MVGEPKTGYVASRISLELGIFERKNRACLQDGRPNLHVTELKKELNKCCGVPWGSFHRELK